MIRLMIISLLPRDKRNASCCGGEGGGTRSLLHITGIVKNGILRSFPRLFRRAETADRLARVFPLLTYVPLHRD